jgi:uncharacterized membrane protein
LEEIKVIEYIGIESIVIIIVVVILLNAYQADKFSKHSIKHIDELQERVKVLEEMLGVTKNR